MSIISNTRTDDSLEYVRECDLRSIDHIAKVMLNRSYKDLNKHEIVNLIRDYYTLIGMRNKGLVVLPVA